MLVVTVLIDNLPDSADSEVLAVTMFVLTN